MIALFTLAAILFVLTVGWLTRPLFTSDSVAVLTERSDLEQLRERLVAQLNELDVERADSGIDKDVAQDEERRLSAELVTVLKQLERLPSSTSGAAANWPTRSRLAPVFVIASILLVIGAGLYTWLNATNIQGFLLAKGSGVNNARVPPMVFEMVAKLEKRLSEQPNDPEGWARLGRSYVVMERKDKALEAYAKAYALAPDNVVILSDYAWLVFNQSPGETTGLAQTLYTRLYQLDAKNPDALWFMGFSAYQQGDYRKALSFWERLLKLLPAEDPGRSQLMQAIASARDKIRP